MNVILLSGGSGKRLWPLSNEVRSKQFLKLFRCGGNTYESMAQRVCRQIRKVSPDANITVTTGIQQKSAVLNQLGDIVEVCVEPERRDTFPAIALAAAYLRQKKELALDDVIIVCPVDPYTDNSYFENFKRLENIAASGECNLTLMGITPTYPSEKYGYLLPENKNGSLLPEDKSEEYGSLLPGGKEAEKVEDLVRRVLEFKEKPGLEEAEELIRKGALWNSGVFAFRTGYILDIAGKYVKNTDYTYLFENYEKLPKLSFDYAVAEQEKNINCITYEGQWKDVGTWNTLAEEMSTDTLGNVLLTDNCQGVNVINELEIPVLVSGVQNVIVAASADGIIISDKDASSYIKPYVESIDQRVMYKEKSWGEFRVLNEGKNAMSIKLNIRSGRSMSYHCHHNRDEVWIVLSGKGMVTVGERTKMAGVGDVVELPAGVRHSIEAVTDMEVMEIQLGEGVSDSDVERFEFQ